MVLENQQLGVKNVAFLTHLFIFFINFAPGLCKKRETDNSRTYAICRHRADQRSNHDAGIYATAMAIGQPGVQPVTMAYDGRNDTTTYTIPATIYAPLPSDGVYPGGNG